MNPLAVVGLGAAALGVVAIGFGVASARTSSKPTRRRARVLGSVMPYTYEEFSERLAESKERPAFFQKTADRIQEAANEIAAKGDGWRGSRKVFIDDVARRLGVSTKKIAGPLLVANNRGWLSLVRADLTAAMDERKVADSEIESPTESRYHFIEARP